MNFLLSRNRILRQSENKVSSKKHQMSKYHLGENISSLEPHLLTLFDKWSLKFITTSRITWKIHESKNHLATLPEARTVTLWMIGHVQYLALSHAQSCCALIGRLCISSVCGYRFRTKSLQIHQYAKKSVEKLMKQMKVMTYNVHANDRRKRR